MQALFTALVPLAVFAQGLGLVWLSAPGGWARWAGVAASIAAALVFSLAWRSSRAWLRIGVVTVSIGGVGMLLGTWLDMRQSAAPPESHHAAHDPAAHHASPAHAGQGLAVLGSWMTGLMLLFCVPACGAFCHSRQSRHSRQLPGSTARELALHGAGLLGMLGGMLLGAAAGGVLLSQALGSALVGHHLAMVAGMGAGSSLGLRAAEALLFEAG